MHVFPSFPFIVVLGIAAVCVHRASAFHEHFNGVYNCSQWDTSVECEQHASYGCSECANTFGGQGACCGMDQSCCNSSGYGTNACCNKGEEKCCTPVYPEGSSYCCAVDTNCCASEDGEMNLCCTPKQTCCSVQYTAQCCDEGWTCCTSPNYHDSVCCSPTQLCCSSGEGGGVCCDPEMQVCGMYGGCQAK